jgi:hypothetical protein
VKLKNFFSELKAKPRKNGEMGRLKKPRRRK